VTLPVPGASLSREGESVVDVLLRGRSGRVYLPLRLILRTSRPMLQENHKKAVA
jgi:hypothetical protein